MIDQPATEPPTIVPKLRFPEFRDAPEWEIKPMASIASEIFSGGTPISHEKKYYHGDIPFIRSAEINNTKTELHLTEKGIQESSATLVEIGDLLVAMYGANSGNVAISKMNGAINQAILCIRTTGSNTYIYQYLNHKKRHITLKYLQGGQGNLSASIIKTIRIPTPKKAERQRIVDCLSSIDEMIATIENRLQTLRDHKQGLLQKLFPATGGTYPALRFPEFRDALGWENMPMGQIVKQILRIVKKPAKPYLGLGIRSFGKGTFLRKAVDPGKNAMSQLYTVSYNDLIVNITFAWEGAIAIATKLDHGALVSHRFPTYAFQTKIALPDFLKYKILDKQFVYELGVISPGGGGRNRVLDRKEFEKLIVCLPSILEQQTIADCLFSADELIATTEQKLQTLRDHKQGLMQQLLVCAGEVNA